MNDWHFSELPPPNTHVLAARKPENRDPGYIVAYVDSYGRWRDSNHGNDLFIIPWAWTNLPPQAVKPKPATTEPAPASAGGAS